MADFMHRLASRYDHWGWELAHLLKELIERARVF